MMSIKQGSIKYYFLSLWYDSTKDGTPVFRTIATHTHTHYAQTHKEVQINPYEYQYVYIHECVW